MTRVVANVLAIAHAARGTCQTRTHTPSGWFVLVLALSIATFQSAQAQTPREIQTFTQENAASCKSAGGTPKQLGSYLTEAADLNGDGKSDYVTNLAGLECANAWSIFCGSAGCPVTVWLSGPTGYSVGWGGSAQDWKLRGKEIVVTIHGQLCKPPRVGAQSCDVAMRFDQAPQREQSAAPRRTPPASAAPAWRARKAGGVVVAEGPGVGALETLRALCLRDRPVIMAALADGAGAAASILFTFTFPDRVVEVTGVAGSRTNRTYILDPRAQGLAAALSGDAADVRLKIASVYQGRLSLDGSSAALSEALSSCVAF